MAKLIAKKHGNEAYLVENGSVIAREYETLTPEGDNFRGRWVYRDATGELIAFDRYINDIAERYNIDLYSDC